MRTSDYGESSSETRGVRTDWMNSDDRGIVTLNYQIPAYGVGVLYTYNLEFNPAKEFARYGILWQPGEVSWVINGEIVRTIAHEGFITDVGHNILMNHWTGNSNWGGRVPLEGNDASAYYDWVWFIEGAWEDMLAKLAEAQATLDDTYAITQEGIDCAADALFAAVAMLTYAPPVFGEAPDPNVSITEIANGALVFKIANALPGDISSIALDGVMFIIDAETGGLEYPGFGAAGRVSYDGECTCVELFEEFLKWIGNGEFMLTITLNETELAAGFILDLEEEEEEVVLLRAVPSAWVDKLNGNQNRLYITVTETYSDGSVATVNWNGMINNNAEGFYTFGGYCVFVNTKGNTQIREIYIK